MNTLIVAASQQVAAFNPSLVGCSCASEFALAQVPSFEDESDARDAFFYAFQAAIAPDFGRRAREQRMKVYLTNGLTPIKAVGLLDALTDAALADSVDTIYDCQVRSRAFPDWQRRFEAGVETGASGRRRVSEPRQFSATERRKRPILLMLAPSGVELCFRHSASGDRFAFIGEPDLDSVSEGANNPLRAAIRYQLLPELKQRMQEGVPVQLVVFATPTQRLQEAIDDALLINGVPEGVITSSIEYVAAPRRSVSLDEVRQQAAVVRSNKRSPSPHPMSVE